jgi:hypothetical protein
VLTGVAQVGLKVHRWVEGHLHGTCCLKDGLYVQVVLLVACRRSSVFLQCSSVLIVANPTDRGLPTCERSPSFRATPAVL